MPYLGINPGTALCRLYHDSWTNAPNDPIPKKEHYIFTKCLSANLLSNIHTLINPDLYVKRTYLNFSQRLLTFIVARENTVTKVKNPRNSAHNSE